jgi:CheY-like chemotaxis protein
MTGRPQVLVIDDDPLFRSVLVSLLRADFDVTVARDGCEGYYKAVESPPDVAIVDVRMPGWDGLRTLRALRRHHTLARCPVMMLTGDADPATADAALRAGANDYVLKSMLTRAELDRRLAALLDVEEQPPCEQEPIGSRCDPAPVVALRRHAPPRESRSGSTGGSDTVVAVRSTRG